MSRSILLLLTAALALPAWGEGEISEQERASAVAALEDAQHAFDELVADVEGDDWTRQPAPGKWSIGEVAEHILLSEKLLYGFIQDAIAAGPNAEWRTVTAGKMEKIEQFMPDRGIKAQAPGPLEPTGEVARATCLAELAAARERTLEFARSTRLPLERYTAEHPADFFGDLNAYQWLHFIAAHHARHNQQIAEVKAWLASEEAVAGKTR